MESQSPTTYKRTANAQTSTGVYSVVCYQTAFGSGVVRNVVRAHLSKEEAEQVADEMDPNLESESWAVELD